MRGDPLSSWPVQQVLASLCLLCGPPEPGHVETLQVLAWLCAGSLGALESGRLVNGPATVVPSRAKVPAYPESQSLDTGSLPPCDPPHPRLGIPSVHGFLSALNLGLVPPTHPCWDPRETGQPRGCLVLREVPAGPSQQTKPLYLVPAPGRNFALILVAGQVLMQTVWPVWVQHVQCSHPPPSVAE